MLQNIHGIWKTKQDVLIAEARKTKSRSVLAPFQTAPYKKGGPEYNKRLYALLRFFHESGRPAHMSNDVSF